MSTKSASCLFIVLLLSFSCSQVEEENKTFNIKINDLDLRDSVLLNAFYGSAERDSLAVNKKFVCYLAPSSHMPFRAETDSIIKSSRTKSLKIEITKKLFYGPNLDHCLCVVNTTVGGEYTCHPCGGVLGLFILKRKDNGKWNCIAHNYDLRIQGSHGHISGSPSLYKISDKDFAVDMSTGFFNAGAGTQSEFHLVVLDSTFLQIHVEAADSSNLFFSSNMGMCDPTKNTIACHEYYSTMTFAKSDESGIYFDLFVNTSGTDLDKNDADKTHEFKQERIYRWKNNQYVLISDITKK